jgi:XTP/dITP diphosphohydrolase
MKLRAGDKLVIATHNAGKLREIGDLLAPFGVEVTSVKALGLPEPEETGSTFIENASIKAMAAATASGMPALADDSGIAVPALNGAPGLYTADWSGPTRDWNLAMGKLWKALRSEDDPSAAFVCALVVAWPSGETLAVEGRVEGHVVWPPRGQRGFGYDPMFVANGMTETFGEIEPAAKHAVSHRADAFHKLVGQLFG